MSVESRRDDGAAVAEVDGGADAAAPAVVSIAGHAAGPSATTVCHLHGTISATPHPHPADAAIAAIVIDFPLFPFYCCVESPSPCHLANCSHCFAFDFVAVHYRTQKNPLHLPPLHVWMQGCDCILLFLLAQ